jgi:hypothetical protein
MPPLGLPLSCVANVSLVARPHPTRAARGAPLHFLCGVRRAACGVRRAACGVRRAAVPATGAVLARNGVCLPNEGELGRPFGKDAKATDF